MKTYKGMRHDITNHLKQNSVGIELGVAKGIYSFRMVNGSHKFRWYYGVDMYADDNHDTEQYKEALKLVGLESPYTLLRMTFDEALDLFEDEYFDFIYVDGFAHTGEEGGKTFDNWWPKLKKGGMFAGDDYHERWPLVVENVNKFCKKKGLEPTVTTMVEDKEYCYYPTWFVFKED